MLKIFQEETTTTNWFKMFSQLGLGTNPLPTPSSPVENLVVKPCLIQTPPHKVSCATAKPSQNYRSYPEAMAFSKTGTAALEGTAAVRTSPGQRAPNMHAWVVKRLGCRVWGWKLGFRARELHDWNTKTST